MADGDRAGHKHLGLCEAGRNIASRAGQRNSQTIGRKKKSEYLAQRRKGRQVRKSKKKFFFGASGAINFPTLRSAVNPNNLIFCPPHSNSPARGERTRFLDRSTTEIYLVELRWSVGVLVSTIALQPAGSSTRVPFPGRSGRALCGYRRRASDRCCGDGS